MKKGLYFSFKFRGFLSVIMILTFISSFLFLAMSIMIDKKGSNVSKSSSLYNNLPLIIIDPGHGGEDGGTSSAYGVNEKDINLAISKKIDILMSLIGYDTMMTRNDDKLIYDGNPSTMRSKKVKDIKNRLSIIESNPENVFLSIHQNYFSESKYSGAQVFYSPNNPESEIIAEHIQNSIKTNIQPLNERKVKKSGKEIYLLYHAESPSVMVECGFMSNEAEAKLLSDEEYQVKISVAIICGLNNYFLAKGEL